YYIDENFVSLLEKEPLLTLPGQRVLVEMSTRQPYPDLHRILFELQMKGYQQILAHPERYTYYRRLEDYANLKTMGCSLQVNLLSLCGYYGKTVLAAAQTLSANGLIDFLGTDLHHQGQLEQLLLARSNEWVYKTMKTNPLKNH